MQNKAQSQIQQANIAAYPQLCGSWPSDEWPDDALIDQHRGFVELCAGSHVDLGSEIESGNMKLQRNYGRVEE